MKKLCECRSETGPDRTANLFRDFVFEHVLTN
jgi:hypothetical protein